MASTHEIGLKRLSRPPPNSRSPIQPPTIAPTMPKSNEDSQLPLPSFMIIFATVPATRPMMIQAMIPMPTTVLPASASAEGHRGLPQGAISGERYSSGRNGVMTFSEIFAASGRFCHSVRVSSTQLPASIAKIDSISAATSASVISMLIS